ncbi:MAG: hypothetical protein E7304_11485 [Butyrivibrio sp.]|jgi:hypothetical protein|uniref:hypothetical protein n=1 Tax=Butyrivibrio sp. TaxID=28121 RepID=UPI001ECE4586|nr:hypothetical protein [Butyrivibrio sp.]MBE5842011.1 hypothetical protein [Butyrivibrio sp.]
MDGMVTYTANNMDEKRKHAKIAFIVMMIIFAVSVCIKHIAMGTTFWDMKDEVTDLFKELLTNTLIRFVLDALLIITLIEKAEKKTISKVIALLTMFYYIYELLQMKDTLMSPPSAYWLIDAIGDAGFEILIRLAFLVFFVVASFRGKAVGSKYYLLALVPFVLALISIAFRYVLNADLYVDLETGSMLIADTLKAHVIKYSPLLFWGIATITKEKMYERLN